MSLYLPTLGTLEKASLDDVLNELAVYIEMSRSTLTVISASEPLENPNAPLYLALDCLLHNTNELVQHLLVRDTEVQHD